MQFKTIEVFKQGPEKYVHFIIKLLEIIERYSDHCLQNGYKEETAALERYIRHDIWTASRIIQAAGDPFS